MQEAFLKRREIPSRLFLLYLLNVNKFSVLLHRYDDYFNIIVNTDWSTWVSQVLVRTQKPCPSILTENLTKKLTTKYWQPKNTNRGHRFPEVMTQKAANMLWLGNKEKRLGLWSSRRGEEEPHRGPGSLRRGHEQPVLCFQGDPRHWSRACGKTANGKQPLLPEHVTLRGKELNCPQAVRHRMEGQSWETGRTRLLLQPCSHRLTSLLTEPKKEKLTKQKRAVSTPTPHTEHGRGGKPRDTTLNFFSKEVLLVLMLQEDSPYWFAQWLSRALQNISEPWQCASVGYHQPSVN